MKPQTLLSFSPLLLTFSAGVCDAPPTPFERACTGYGQGVTELDPSDVSSSLALFDRYPSSPDESCDPAARVTHVRALLPWLGRHPNEVGRTLLRQGIWNHDSGRKDLVSLSAQTEIAGLLMSAGRVERTPEVERLLRRVDRLVVDSAARRSRAVAPSRRERARTEQLWRAYRTWAARTLEAKGTASVSSGGGRRDRCR